MTRWMSRPGLGRPGGGSTWQPQRSPSRRGWSSRPTILRPPATFYGKLLGWDVTVSDDPQYGGYAMARLADGEGDVAGITAKMMPEAPTAWSLYIETDDAAALGEAVQAAGGSVIAPAFDVGRDGPHGRVRRSDRRRLLGLAGGEHAQLPHRRAGHLRLG